MRILRGVLFIFIGIFLCNFASGFAGVRPAIYEVDFKPNLNEKFSFIFYFDEGSEEEIYVSGDLMEYVSVDKQKMKGTGSVTAFLKLPSELSEPGVHVIRVGARQIPPEFSGMGLVADIRGLIRIRVPYPGKYAALELTTKNANVGNPVETKLKIYSRGKEDISVSAFYIISNEEGEVDRVSMGSHLIPSTQNVELFKSINTTNYLPGNYNITAVVAYGGEKPAETEGFFRLGELRVEISNYTKIFEKDKIARMEIEVESFWNEEIENVYANVSILDSDLSFLTPSITLKPWRKQELIGFFDTSEINSSRFEANISIHYGDKITSQIVDLKFKFEINTMMIIIGGLMAVILILLIVIVFVLRKYGVIFKKK